VDANEYAPPGPSPRHQAARDLAAWLQARGLAGSATEPERSRKGRCYLVY